MSILNHPDVNSFYFYPQTFRCESAIEIQVNGATLRCLYHRVSAELPTLVHFHGNGEAVGHYARTHFVSSLLSSVGDMNILLIEYRGYGGSSGTPQLVAMLDDGEAVLRYLKVNPATAIGYGRSIGSLYALELAARCPTLAGLFIDSGIADIRTPFLEPKNLRKHFDSERQGSILTDIDRYFDHQHKIASFRGRLVICHTLNDRIILPESARQLYDWANTSDKELRMYAGGDHSTIFAYNRNDMLFALKRMMAAIAPTRFTLPVGSPAELRAGADPTSTQVLFPTGNP